MNRQSTIFFVFTIVLFVAMAYANGPSPVGNDVTLTGTTIDAVPSFKDATGTATRALVDSSDRVITNIGSETIGLISGISSVSGDIGAIGTKLDTIDLTIHAVDGNLASVSADIVNGNASASGDIARLEAELSDAHADPSAAPTYSFAVMSYLSDNANIVPWFTALVLGDGVNGNNQAAMANWLYDGVAWYRGRSLASSGVALAIEPAATTITQQTITLTPGVVSTITSLSGRRSISIKGYSTNAETIWLSYDNVSTAAAVLSGDELAPGARISINLPEGLTVGMIASTAETVYVCEQGD